jgi:cell division transport system permease protein
MNLRSLIKSTKLGLDLVKEAPTIFFASTGLIIINAILIWFTIFISYFLDQINIYLKERINFSIYFTPNTSLDDISKLQKILKEFPGVKDVVLVSKEEALEKLKKAIGYSTTLQKALETIKINPLSDYLVVKADEPKVYEEIFDYLMQSRFKPNVEFLTYFENQKAIQKLISFSKIVKSIVYFLIIFVLFLTSILIFYLSTLVIFSQKENIEIFKLLGATRAFIRIPFYVIFSISSFLGTFLATLLIIFSLKALARFSIYLPFSISPQDFLKENFWPLSLFVLGIVIFISLLATRLSLRKYLKY